MRVILILFSSLTLILSYGQGSKNERETRLKKSEMPDSILKSLEGYLETSKKVRYFSESDNEHMSFEVKLSFNGSRYSIEFDQSGKLEDIEVNIQMESLSDDPRTNILKHLSSYDKFSIDKIQRQFSSPRKTNEEIIKDAFQNGTSDIIRYEIEVNVKQKGKWTSYEMLFSENGQFLTQRIIIHRSSEFILY